VLAVTVMPGNQLKHAIEETRFVRERVPDVKVVWGGYFPSLHTDVVLRSELVDATFNGRDEKLPEVEYEFSVRFDKFRGKRISIGEIMPGSAQVQTVLTLYPAGATATVFYDPGNPRDCVLERDVPQYFGVIWVFVAVVTLACLLGAAMLLR